MHGVPIERYFVTTDDGYILRLYHLPPRSLNTNNTVIAKPIFFMHGQISSSQDFVAYRNSSAGERIQSCNTEKQKKKIFEPQYFYHSQHRKQATTFGIAALMFG